MLTLPLGTKLAEMLWAAVTLEKVYVLTAPTETPSTMIPSILKPLFGVTVKLWLPPSITEVLPLGEMLPPPPALALIVK